MKFLSTLALLPSLISSVVATPIASNAGVAAAAADPVPGVERLTKVSEQLTVLITEIKASSDTDVPGAQRVVDHAATLIRTLDTAVIEIENGPDIDLWTAVSYARIAVPLTSQVHDLSAALKDKEQAIATLGVGGPIFQILDASYAEMSRLQKVYLKKVPSFLRPIVRPWLSDITETLGEVKENFRTYAQNDNASAAPPPPAPYNSPASDAYPPPPQFDQNGGYYTTTVVVYVPGPTPAAALPSPAWQAPDLAYAHAGVGTAQNAAPSAASSAAQATAKRPAWEAIYEASKGDNFEPAYSPAGLAAPRPTA